MNIKSPPKSRKLVGPETSLRFVEAGRTDADRVAVTVTFHRSGPACPAVVAGAGHVDHPGTFAETTSPGSAVVEVIEDDAPKAAARRRTWRRRPGLRPFHRTAREGAGR